MSGNDEKYVERGKGRQEIASFFLVNPTKGVGTEERACTHGEEPTQVRDELH